MNSLKARLDRVQAWLEAVQPDALCMQETKVADAAPPEMGFRALQPLYSESGGFQMPIVGHLLTAARTE